MICAIVSDQRIMVCCTWQKIQLITNQQIVKFGMWLVLSKSESFSFVFHRPNGLFHGEAKIFYMHVSCIKCMVNTFTKSLSLSLSLSLSIYIYIFIYIYIYIYKYINKNKKGKILWLPLMSNRPKTFQLTYLVPKYKWH